MSYVRISSHNSSTLTSHTKEVSHSEDSTQEQIEGTIFCILLAKSPNIQKKVIENCKTSIFSKKLGYKNTSQ